MHIEISSTIFLSVVLLMGLGQLFLSYRFRKSFNGQEKKIRALKNDVQALLLCARGVGEKLHNQQSEVKTILNRQDKLELGEGAGEVSYKQVIALMNRGATADEMVSSCGLSQGEVELLAQLQKNRQSAKSSQRHLAA